MTLVMAIYIGKKANPRRNLQHGIESRTWGFPGEAKGFTKQSADYILIATNHSHGGPHAKVVDWPKGTLTIVICKALGDFYDATAPHWDDEFAAGKVKYHRRFGMIPIALAQGYQVASLDAGLAEQFRLSGLAKGHGKFVDADVDRLFEFADLPIPSKFTAISQAPGIPDFIEKVRKARGAGFVQDAARRMETEQYAVKEAKKYLESLGYTFIKELGKPYDLLFHDSAGQEVHVEVKGTSSAGETVFLTDGEVNWHRINQRGMLIVVSDITFNPNAEAGARCSGGRLRMTAEWVPRAEHLRPTQYTYVIPWNEVTVKEVSLLDQSQT